VEFFAGARGGILLLMAIRCQGFHAVNQL